MFTLFDLEFAVQKYLLNNISDITICYKKCNNCVMLKLIYVFDKLDLKLFVSFYWFTKKFDANFVNLFYFLSGY